LVAGLPKALTDFAARGDEPLNRLFGEMVDALPVAIYTTDSEGRLKYFNAAAVSLSGRVPELGTDQWCVTWKLFRPDGTPLPHDQCPMAIALKRGDVPRGVECMAERPDGTRFWFTPYPVILRDANGQIIGGMNLLVDITDRKNAQIAAIETVRQLRLITENMDVGVTRCTADLRYLWVNRAYAHWLGQMPDDIAGRPIVDVIGQEAYDIKGPYIEKVLSGQRVEFETRTILPGARAQWVRAVYVPTKGEDGYVDGWIAVVTDVTDRRDSEERLRTNERQFKEAQHLAKVGSWEQDLSTGSSIRSDEMFRILGVSDRVPSNFPAFLNSVHPADREKILAAERQVLCGDAPVTTEYRIIQPNGEVCFVRSVAAVIRNNEGVPVRVTGATEDITDQVKARELLRQSERRLKNAERLANLGHWDWDLSGNQVTWSEETCRIFGQPLDYKPSYEDLLQITIPEDKERLDQVVKSSLAKNQGFVVEFQIARPDGDRRMVRSISEISVDEENGLPLRLFGTVQDITNEKRAQEESFARRKLEIVGTLATGVAHDFNNLLGSALSQAELGLMQLETGLSAEEQLNAIHAVAIRGSEIVRQLLIYAGKESAVVELADLSIVVEEMLELIRLSVSKHVKIELSLGTDLPAVRANGAQLRQIVMNLVINASEAMGTRDGTICVTTSYTKTDQTSSGVIADNFSAPDYVALEVSDTGDGMPPETQARVFDPFFTTKSTGHGLGLATVQGIVRNLGGLIHLASEPGKGTTFRILLPFTDIPARETRDSLSTRERFEPSLGTTVLVVEDEDSLRDAVATMLRKTGFEVIEAADGSAAIDVLHAHKIDVILLDATIPGASSDQVLAEAAEVRPDTRVILTSAHSREMLTSAINTAQVRGFVRKPFQLADLLKALRENL
jgi:two-component system, cell cycle sensor histidine kinase and response regulator CckA